LLPRHFFQVNLFNKFIFLAVALQQKLFIVFGIVKNIFADTVNRRRIAG
jgi:hypothetical protein